jgi:hypothetical protein
MPSIVVRKALGLSALSARTDDVSVGGQVCVSPCGWINGFCEDGKAPLIGSILAQTYPPPSSYFLNRVARAPQWAHEQNQFEICLLH